MIGEKLSEVYEEIEATLYEHHGTKPNLTDKGFRAACKIFIDAVMDKMWDRQEKESKSIEGRIKEAEILGYKIRAIVLEHTGIDTHNLS